MGRRQCRSTLVPAGQQNGSAIESLNTCLHWPAERVGN